MVDSESICSGKVLACTVNPPSPATVHIHVQLPYSAGLLVVPISTGCTSYVSWVQFPTAAGLFTSLYFHLLKSKSSLVVPIDLKILKQIKFI